jgi:excisionase family DNA binding protein
VTSGVTGVSGLSAGLHEPFKPLTSLGLTEAESVRSTRLFSPFPEAFGPTLVQNTRRRRKRLSKATAVQFLTVREAAARLRVSPATIYALCARGKLPHARVSNSLLISAGEVEALLRSACTEKD